VKQRPLQLQGKIIDGTHNSNNWFPSLLPGLYPGSLNVLLNGYRPDIEWHTDIFINEGKYTGKILRLGNCLINDIPALIVKPPNFKYIKRYNWVEIAHSERLRDLLNLKNNDIVTITFVQGSISKLPFDI